MVINIQIVLNALKHTYLIYFIHFHQKGIKKISNLDTLPKFRRIRARYKSLRSSEGIYLVVLTIPLPGTVIFFLAGGKRATAFFFYASPSVLLLSSSSSSSSPTPIQQRELLIDQFL